MISPGVGVGVGMIRGVGLGRGVGVTAWEVEAVAMITNAKVAKTIVILFVNLIGVLSWTVRDVLFSLLSRVPENAKDRRIVARIF